MTATSTAARALGRLGGRAGTGAAKARTPEQARAAALARWGRRHSVAPVAPAAPSGSLSLAMLRDIARDLPTMADPWRLAEAGRLLAQAADEIARLRK